MTHQRGPGRFTAREIFIEVALLPAVEAPEGLHRLRAACTRFLDHVDKQVFPGGASSRQHGELPDDSDPTQAAFELNAFVVAANTASVLHGDRAALQRASRAIDERLSVGEPS